VAWTRPRGDGPLDAAHMLLSNVSVPLLVRAAIFAPLVALALALQRALAHRLWPHAWPLYAQVALALALAEFAQYWIHRLAHERDGLWRIHALPPLEPAACTGFNAGAFTRSTWPCSTPCKSGPLLLLGAVSR